MTILWEVTAIYRRNMRTLGLLACLIILLAALPGTLTTVLSQFDLPLRGLTIVVDPGHGGIDDGTRAGGHYLEKDINLQLGFALRDALQRLGAQVVMTRETDISLSKRDKVYTGRHREDLARRVEIVHENDADLFISVHCNACPEYPAARGAIVYYADISPVGRQMADTVQGRLNSMNLASFGAKVRPHAPVGADYFVLRNTSCPGILLEAGYLSNGVDLRLLTSKKFQASLAHSVSMGIADWRRLPAPEPEPETEGSLAILIMPNLRQTNCSDWLAGNLPLTFLLSSADPKALEVADMISASGQEALLLQPDSGSEVAVCYADCSDAELSIGAGTLAQLPSSVMPTTGRQDDIDSRVLASVQQARQQGSAALLLDLSNHTGLASPGSLLTMLEEIMKEHPVQPVYASDLIFPTKHHGP